MAKYFVFCGNKPQNKNDKVNAAIQYNKFMIEKFE